MSLAPPEELAALLQAREERAELQRRLLAAARGAVLCQVSLNIPGLPKRLAGDRAVLEVAARGLAEGLGQKATSSNELTNAAGMAILMLFAVPAESAKRVAVALEEGEPWGRILDIDVMTEEGAVPRSQLGIGVRSCFLCGEEAKACARLRAHDLRELRLAAELLLAPFADSASSADSLPFSSSVSKETSCR